MILKNKKGLTASFLVGLIITVVAFMIIAGLVFRFMADSGEKESELLCHDSIALRAATALQINQGDGADWHDMVQATIKTAPVLCKTIDIKLSGSREEIKRKFAEKIAKCWWMFGEGRYEEILDTGDFNVLPALLGTHNEPNKCFNCYNIMIDQDEIDGDGDYKCADSDSCPITSQEFARYLWDENPLKTRGECHGGIEAGCQECLKDNECEGELMCIDGWCEKEVDINYLKYIQSYGGPGMFINILSQEGIQARHAYSISILPKNKEKEQTSWLLWVGVGLVVVGAIACTVATWGACAGAIFGTAGATAATTTTVVAGATATTAVATGGGVAAAGATATAVAAATTTTAVTAGSTIGATAAAGTLTLGAKATAGAFAYDYLTKPDEKSAPNLGGNFDNAVRISIETMFKERMRSSIYLSETKYGQTYCGTGDLGGD